MRLTDLDERRLRDVVRRLSPAQRKQSLPLVAGIARAIVINARAMPNDVVTMNSHVVLYGMETGWSAATLVYPDEAAGEGDVSILSPLGTALLGARALQEVCCAPLGGSLKRVRVRAIPYQPERYGDFHL